MLEQYVWACMKVKESTWYQTELEQAIHYFGSCRYSTWVSHFKLHDPEKLLGDKEDVGITCALIPADHEGVVIGERHDPLGLAFMNGPTRGHDVFIPMEWLIGGADYAGKGWRMLVECLSAGRGISLPALGTAMGHLTATYNRCLCVCT